MQVDKEYLNAMRDDMIEDGYDSDFIEEVIREFVEATKSGKPMDLEY